MAPTPRRRRVRRRGGGEAAAASADRDGDDDDGGDEERAHDDDPADGPPAAAAAAARASSPPLRIPDKLVKFIRSNRRDVLPYFQQLRANLVSDVDKYKADRDRWRDRALEAEAELTALRRRGPGGEANGEANAAGGPSPLDGEGGVGGEGGDDGVEEGAEGARAATEVTSTAPRTERRKKRKGGRGDDGDGVRDGDVVEGEDEVVVEKTSEDAVTSPAAAEADAAEARSYEAEDGGVAIDDGMFDMALSSSSSSPSSASESEADDDGVAPSASLKRGARRRRERGDGAPSGEDEDEVAMSAAPKRRRKVQRGKVDAHATPPPPSQMAVPGRLLLCARSLRERRLEEAGRCLEMLGVSVVSWEEREVVLGQEDDREEEGEEGQHDGGDDVDGGGDGVKEAASSATDRDEGGDGGTIDGRRQGPADEATPATVGGRGAPDQDDAGAGAGTGSTAKDEKEGRGRVRLVARRRGDADVAADLLRSLRVLCRATTTTTTATTAPPANPSSASTSATTKTKGTTTWGPFVDVGGEKGVVPCCFDPTPRHGDGDNDTGTEEPHPRRGRHPHPAAEGLRLACRALAILDTWSEDRFLTSSLPLSSGSVTYLGRGAAGGDDGVLDRERVAGTDAISEPDDHDYDGHPATPLLGLRDRRGLVDAIVSSVEGEATGACGAWALADRRARLVSPSLHYRPDEDDDDENDDCGGNNDDDDDDDDAGGPEARPQTQLPLGVTFHPSSHSRNRLCSLVDRCIYAHLLAYVYHGRNDPTSVARVILGYVFSAGPVCNVDVEDYPTLPPVLSMCVVEAFLRRDDGGEEEGGDDEGHGGARGDVDRAGKKSSWFGRVLEVPTRAHRDDEARSSSPSSLTLEAAAVSIRAAARTWRIRSRSSDARIRDVAVAELDAYRRLLRAEAGWLGGAAAGGCTTHHRRVRFGEVTTNGERDGGDDDIDRSATDIVGDALVELLGVEGVESKATRASSGDGGRRRFPDRVGVQTLSNGDANLAGGGSIVRDAIDALQLSLVTSGDTQLLFTTCANVMGRLEKVLPLSDEGDEVPREELHVSFLLGVIVVCCVAYQRISSIVMEDRRVRRALAFAGHHEKGLAPRLPQPPVMGELSPMGRGMFETSVLGKLVHLLLRGGGIGDGGSLTASDWALAATLARCATILADGGLSFFVVRWVVKVTGSRDRYGGDQLEGTTAQNGCKHDGRTGRHYGGCHPHRPHPLRDHGVAAAMQTILFAGELPTVRVINLERRKDRWCDILVQAQRAELLSVRAVHRIGSDSEITMSSSSITNTKIGSGTKLQPEQLCFGDYAYDGRGGGMVDFERAVNSTLRGNDRLSDYVESHWNPGTLVAVDKHAARAAEKEGATVMLDPTERACALSHIASWRGVLRSLVDCHLTDKASKDSSTASPGAFARQFEISGFARGRALFPWNRSTSATPPGPAFVILEDDAVLVDRFSERLSALLEELPRDFHFCSLGYSRPKAAPMIKFSKNLGVPTFLWYLTGYIISLEGARYLLDSLPVVGPVDSWVGVKMCSNWDMDGIVTSSGGKEMSKVLARLHLKNPDRRELVERLDFRCFAALVPLCSQKMGVTSPTTSTAAQVKWRDRDTDISYSGYAVQ